MNDRPSRRRRAAWCGSLSLLALALPVLAHTDDPKATSVLPRYEGPGWREAEGGVAGDAFASLGVQLRSWLTNGDLGASYANDCWGYTSTWSGGIFSVDREYAIIGLSNGTAFVEITDPGDPQLVEIVQGPSSIWRDIKTYGTYAYAVSEGGGGIQVIDLSQIDNGTVTLVGNVTDGGTSSSHNVAINEESGWLYRVGGGGNGLRFYDLADPANPTYVGGWSDRYVHDAQIVTMSGGPWAGREIAVCCSGFNGGWNQPGIDILDVTDKQNVQLLSRYEYPNARYSHQAWLSEDAQHLFLNDEQDEDQLGVSSTMHIISCADLENPVEVATFTNGLDSITHNLYVRGNLVFAANYSSGVRVFDVTNPAAPSEVGFFDTNPDNNGTNFNGLWSVYPYFESGTVIGSDRERGLFVWSTDLPGPGNPLDVDGSGTVDVADLVEVIMAWGPCGPTCPADVDGSGTVDVADLVAVILGWS